MFQHTAQVAHSCSEGKVGYSEQRIIDFLDTLASAEPTPGGGSAAALGGALAAALVSMVCNLTLGKKGYEAVQGEMEAIRTRSEALRGKLARLLEADTQAYQQVMAAYRLPRRTAEEKEAREATLQAALVEATEVPLAIAEACAEVMELALPAAQKGNRWAASDAGVAVLLAEAALHGALLNVRTNLASLRDEALAQRLRERMAGLVEGKEDLKERVLGAIAQTVR